MFVIDADLQRDLVDYLTKRPWVEVNQLIVRLARAEKQEIPAATGSLEEKK